MSLKWGQLGKKSRATLSAKRNCFVFDGGRKERYIVAGSRSSVSSDSSCLGVQCITHKFNNNWTGKQMSSLQILRLFFLFSEKLQDRLFVCQVPWPAFSAASFQNSDRLIPNVFENHTRQGLLSQDFRSKFFFKNYFLLGSWLLSCCNFGYFFLKLTATSFTFCGN